MKCVQRLKRFWNHPKNEFEAWAPLLLAVAVLYGIYWIVKIWKGT